MAITKIHAVKVRLGDAINYIENPDKTDGQELISGYNTAPQTAVLDFSVTAAMARKARNTSAKKQGNLAYHMIQSFSPDDAVTPERAHELGRKLAMEFTDGKFEFVVATHINKDSIHNHIIINAVSFYDYKKLRTVPYRTAQQIRSISDRLCMESQLSVIKDPQQLGQLYPTYIQKKRTTSNRTEVRKKLNFCLERATNYAQFLQMAQELGISVCQRGKHMHVMCTGHDGVTDARDNKYDNVVFYTVFQNNIPIMAVDAAQKHCVDAVQHGKILDAFPRRSCGNHFVLGIKTVLINQLLHTTSSIINNSCGLRREGFKVGVVSVISPN